jgi:hypothetical protein
MVEPNRIRAAMVAALREPTDEIGVLLRVCQVCVDMLPVDGASVSVLSDPDRELLCATDDVSAQIAALQFSLGEGPAFEAVASGRPVLIPNLAIASAQPWPMFAAEMSSMPPLALFTFPLQHGAISVGALDFYRREPGWLTGEELAVALQVVDIATLALLNVKAGLVDGERWAVLPRHREQVHQATGMLIAALGMSAEHALARLRGHAFASGRLIDEVAHDVVTRRISPLDLDR